MGSFFWKRNKTWQAWHHNDSGTPPLELSVPDSGFLRWTTTGHGAGEPPVPTRRDASSTHWFGSTVCVTVPFFDTLSVRGLEDRPISVIPVGTDLPERALALLHSEICRSTFPQSRTGRLRSTSMVISPTLPHSL